MPDYPAKITRPRLSGVFPRTRLFRLLDRGRKRPVVWVSGPPGSGKTTMVSSYLDTRKLPCLWYQVDDRDGDAATFFHYLGLAGRKAAPRKRKPLPHLTPEYLLGLPAFTRRYFEELFSRLKAPFLVVFDNFQEVSADSPFHGVIANGLAEVPEGGNVTIISRTAPLSSLARLRANDAMAVLGWNELKLTPEEADGIARLRSPRKSPSQEATRQFHRKTQGWAAGLVLMLEQSQTADLSPRAWADATPDVLFDYFAGEIFQGMDNRTQDVLLKSAFLPKMTPWLLEQLAGEPKAGRLLADLSHENYFTVKHLQPESAYQYHPLFREFLLSQARDTFTPEKRVQVQKKAGELLEAAGQVEDAVELFREARDWQGMALTLLKHAQAFLQQGRGRVLGQWLESLPQELRTGNPWLLFWLGNCVLPIHPGEARAHFENAYTLFKAGGDRAGQLLAWAGVVNTVNFELADCDVLDRWIDEMERLLEADPSYPSPEIEARVAYAMFSALALRQPGHPAIKHWEQRAESLALKSPDINQRMEAAFVLTLHRLWGGDFTGAGMVVNVLRGWVQMRAASPLVQLVALQTEAMYHWLTASPQATLQKVDEGMALARETGVHVGEHMLLEHGVAAALSIEDHATANRLLQQLGSTLDRARLVDVAFYRYLVCWQALLQGDLAVASRHASTFLEMARKLGLAFAEGLTYVANAEVLCAQGKYQDASAQLSQGLKHARGMNSRLLEFMALVIDAGMALDQGEEARALEVLRRTLAIGREQGYLNFFGWRSEVMTRLCLKALEAGIEVDYVQELIRKRGLVPDAPPLEIEHWPWAVKIFTLGRFALLADGKPVRFSGKAQRRPLDLLKALVAFGGREVGEEQLAEALWPDAEGDAAHRAFEITLHRLRKLIGHEASLVLKERRLSLDPRTCWVDVWAFERLLGKVDAALKAEHGSEVPGGTGGAAKRDKAEALGRLVEKALALYQGPFLDTTDQPWSWERRERLRSKLLRLLAGLGRCREDAGQWHEAVACYQRGLEFDLIAELFYQRLMIAYQKLGHRAEALAVYERCCDTLRRLQGADPSPETHAIYVALRSRR